MQCNVIFFVINSGISHHVGVLVRGEKQEKCKVFFLVGHDFNVPNDSSARSLCADGVGYPAMSPQDTATEVQHLAGNLARLLLVAEPSTYQAI